MIDFDNALTALRLDILKLVQLERDRLDLLNSPLSAAMKDERDKDFKSDIERRSWERRRLVRRIPADLTR